MSSREWKPGDVAMVRQLDGTERLAVVGHYRSAALSGPHFVYATGGYDDVRGKVDAARLLVVIDPENREQVAALLNAWERAEFSGTLPAQPMTRMELRLRTALREFANPTPPKPDEPTGDGAVVEDRMGHRWVRIAGSAVDSPPWRHRGHTARWWDSVQAVRVLSEGVTS